MCAMTSLLRAGAAGAVFYYSRDRAGEHPQAHLANYAGISRPTPIAAMASSRVRARARPILERPVGFTPGVRSS